MNSVLASFRQRWALGPHWLYTVQEVTDSSFLNLTPTRVHNMLLRPKDYRWKLSWEYPNKKHESEKGTERKCRAEVGPYGEHNTLYPAKNKQTSHMCMTLGAILKLGFRVTYRGASAPVSVQTFYSHSKSKLQFKTAWYPPHIYTPDSWQG